MTLGLDILHAGSQWPI